MSPLKSSHSRQLGFVRFLLPLVLLVGVLFFGCKKTVEQKQQDETEKPSPVFQSVSSEDSGIDFKNQIQEDVNSLANLFNYDYFYNGAGVGIADLNNDGLPDIFFCGNQVDNKLYINQGNLTFSDISPAADINAGKVWSNGVTFVDINADGWLDIYVSQGGPNPRLQRKNLLFINQQDDTFIESAADYGLADMGISTQSVFFDYDRDGDLDCLVMNENELYGVDPINLYRLVAENEESTYFNSSHLYRNDNGRFVDVTKEAGIERPIFGLGLSVADLNNDGWLDFYIASDYYIPDALFINNHDGTFSDEIKTYTKQISFYGMGMDVADINNDGQQDIFVLDMAANDHVRSKTLMASMNTDRFDYLINDAGFHHQYMYNSLQLRTSDTKFSNISQATTMANTDWSWSVLMSDFDNDTDKDIYITNGYRRYALDNDLQRSVFEAKRKYKGQVPLAVKKQLYESMPSEKLPNILYENGGKLDFSEKAKSWGLADFSFSNGAAQGDLDNDGDLDLVVNNIDDVGFLYRNMTMENGGGNYLKIKAQGKLSEAFPQIAISYKGETQLVESRRVRGYRSAHEDISHFGLGAHDKVDSVIVKWPNGAIQRFYEIEANTLLEVNEKDGDLAQNVETSPNPTYFNQIDVMKSGLDFVHKENTYDDFATEVLLPYKQSTLGPFVTKGDVNGDQLEDLYIGGASGQYGMLYLQRPNGEFTAKSTKAFENDRSYEDMQGLFFDFDGDGDLDLFVVSGGNEFANYSSLYADRLYLNDGIGNFSKAEIDALQRNPKSGRSVDVIDFNRDGQPDLLVGNRIVAQNYPNPSSSTLWKNENGTLIDVTAEVAHDLERFGIINDILVTDYNRDGWADFIAVGEWTGIGFFTNSEGRFTRDNDLVNSEENQGWWFGITETDVNNDGLPDYVLGNAGLNIKFKASQKKPFKVFSNDFDGNGTNDIVLSKQYNGEYVPVRGRECSSQQMPFIQQKFEPYSEFANAKLVDIYGEKLNSGFEGEVTEFRSSLLLNNGDGTFSKHYLPFEAQLFPILDLISLDIDKDGFEDLIVGGNIYETEVETPRLDAFSGLVLLSNRKDGYTPLPWVESGLLLEGNIKDLDLITGTDDLYLIATQNDGPVQLHSLIK